MSEMTCNIADASLVILAEKIERELASMKRHRMHLDSNICIMDRAQLQQLIDENKAANENSDWKQELAESSNQWFGTFHVRS